jgi:hypothetical protein
MVGAEGFEPPTLCSQSRCATRLRYAPTSKIVSQACTIRTARTLELKPLLPTDLSVVSDGSGQPVRPCQEHVR